MSSRKVSTILDRFGDRCLLILDGLDEHGKNQDVLRIIRNETLLDCGILVSSRPHSTNEVELYFPTIIRVDGFTSEKAEEFVLNFFTEETKIRQILEFRPSDARENFPVHRCPILLSFLCLLVKENKIDLADTKLTVGDLYLRMVQCLYQKFTIRKGMKFVNGTFVQVIKSVGTLALRTLLSNKPFLQRSEIERIADEHAFEYGFFTGHEDFRLCPDPTADIYVTYAHRSIEEFFGSFGFLQALDDGKSVDDILGSDCEKPIFMTNPLVLKFCFWLLSCQDLGFTHREEYHEKLVSYVVNCIDHEQFDPRAIAGVYRAIDILKSVKEGNRSEMLFYRNILEKCWHIKTFYIRRDVSAYKEMFTRILNQTDWIFGCLNKEVLEKLTLVSIGDYLPRDDCPKTDSLTISINIDDMLGSVLLDMLLNKYGLRSKYPQVYLEEKILHKNYNYNLSEVISKHIKELHLWTCRSSTLMASNEITFCPVFTSLTVHSFQIDPSVPSALMKAVNDGNLPNLRCIELDLVNIVNMKIANWPEVPDFRYGTSNLGNFKLSLRDLLSKLTCLTLQNPVRTGRRFLGPDSRFLANADRLFTKQLTKLSALRLVDIDHECFSELATVLKQDKLPNLSELSVSCPKLLCFYPEFDWINEKPNLFDSPFRNVHPKHMGHLDTVSFQRCIMSADELRSLSNVMSSCHLRELDISDNERIEGCLSMLFTNSFQTLQSLTLGKLSLGLNKEDIESLVKASDQGKLQNLRHLFIYGLTASKHLFTGREKWNRLLTLYIGGCNVLDLGPEYLASLQSLHLYETERRDLTIRRCWPHLQIIKSTEEVLMSVVEGVHKSLLPALKVVKGYYGVSDVCIFKLHKANITYIQY